MNTLQLVQSLEIKLPDIHKLFFLCGVLPNITNITPHVYKQYHDIIEDFKSDIKIVCVFGIIPFMIILNPRPMSNTRASLIVEGVNSYHDMLTISTIKKYLIKALANDYPVFLRKIVYIQDYQTLEGNVFSQYTSTQWTTGKGMAIPPDNVATTTGENIINVILSDIQGQ